MHKTHWGPAIVAMAGSALLTIMPANSARGETLYVESLASDVIAESGGDLIHGVFFLAIVMVAVAISQFDKSKH